MDFDPATKYTSLTEVDEETKGDVEMQEEESITAPKLNEYIFLIDRSGSMHNTIVLARQALQLFI